MFKDFNRLAGRVIEAEPIRAVPAAQLSAIEKEPAQDASVRRHLDLKARLHELLLDRLNLSVIDKVQPAELRREIMNLVPQLLVEE